MKNGTVKWMCKKEKGKRKGFYYFPFPIQNKQGKWGK